MAGPIGTKFDTRLWIHLGMDMAKNNSPHDTPWRHHFGFFRGSTIQKTGKCGQTVGPTENNLCTYNADESRNGHMLNKLAP